MRSTGCFQMSFANYNGRHYVPLAQWSKASCYETSLMWLLWVQAPPLTYFFWHCCLFVTLSGVQKVGNWYPSRGSLARCLISDAATSSAMLQVRSHISAFPFTHFTRMLSLNSAVKRRSPHHIISAQIGNIDFGIKLNFGLKLQAVCNHTDPFKIK